MAKLTLDVVTPHGVTFSDQVDFVVAEGVEGQLGILPGHIPFFTAIKIGILSYKKDGFEDFLAVNGGFLDVNGNKVTVLSSSAELAGDIDSLRAIEERKLAEQDLFNKAGDVDFAKAEKEIIKSVTRLKAVELLEKAGKGKKKL